MCAVRIQVRRDIASAWTAANPTLAQGELGFETDAYKLKIGDGSTAWTALSYLLSTAHNDLFGLQGGQATEYYHLTSAQHTLLTANDHNALSNIDGGAVGEYYHLTSAQHTLITPYEHNSLNSIDGGAVGEYYHLTSAQHTLITPYEHNSLNSIDGGAVGEYYHLTSAQHTIATNYTHNTLNSIDGGAVGEYYHLTSAQHTLLTAYAHNSLNSIDGGAVGEYYHLTSAQHTAATTGLATTYLKLDCSNDPLTGGLEIDTTDATPLLIQNSVTNVYHVKSSATEFIIYAGAFTFEMTSAPLIHSGTDYSDNFGTPGSDDNCFYINDKASLDVVEIAKGAQEFLYSVDGTFNIGVVCVAIAGGAFGNVTFYFDTNDFTGGVNPVPATNRDDYFDTWLADATGAPISVDYYHAAIFTFNGDADYTWANPDSKVICGGFTSPPHIYAMRGEGINVERSTGNIVLNGTLTNTFDKKMSWVGKIDVGTGGSLPLLDYCIQVSKNMAYAGSGTASALNFFLSLTNNTASSVLYAGVYGGVSIQGSANVGIVSGAYLGNRFDSAVTTGVSIGAQANVTLTNNGPAITDNVGYICGINDESGGGSSGTITSNTAFRGYALASKGGWSVSTSYTLYCYDNSAYATTSWGVYNLDRSYLGGTIVNTDGTIVPVSLADASAANSTIYYSTTQSKLVFKDSGGTVNALY